MKPKKFTYMAALYALCVITLFFVIGCAKNSGALPMASSPAATLQPSSAALNTPAPTDDPNAVYYDENGVKFAIPEKWQETFLAETLQADTPAVIFYYRSGTGKAEVMRIQKISAQDYRQTQDTLTNRYLGASLDGKYILLLQINESSGFASGSTDEKEFNDIVSEIEFLVGNEMQITK